jgi:hypothetical protein
VKKQAVLALDGFGTSVLNGKINKPFLAAVIVIVPF